MKHWIQIVVIIGLTMSACTTSDQTGVTVSVLEDVTEDYFIARPNASAIHSKFSLDDDAWQSATFRYGAISSLVHNKRMEERLEGGEALLGNQLERDAKIKQFYAQIVSLLQEPGEWSEHQYSSIWSPLVEELAHLQRDSSSQTALYLFSDLQENNSEWFSVHRYKDLVQLDTCPDKVEALFLEQASALRKGSLYITVVVVYQPKTMEEDKAFAKMRKLYTHVFAELAIPIAFVSHLN